jgi:CheY-like chemotaxis protein
LKNPQEVTILVVDDEEHLRESILFDFSRKGFNVLSAENGRKAFDLIALNKVDLVISDIRMPGGDGIELLERIRANHPTLPQVIILTGFADVKETDVYAKGAQKVLPKPFERKELIAAVYQFTGVELSK